MEITIYTLEDPVTKDIKYVGITSDTLKSRLDGHIKSSKYRKRKAVSGKERWILDLLEKGLKPVIKELETLEDSFDFIQSYIEVYWIWQLKSWGFDLLNIAGLVMDYNNIPERTRYKTPINQYDLDGNFIKRYDSIALASKTVNGVGSIIQRAAKNTGWKAYGYQWRYDKDAEDNIGPVKSKLLPNECKKIAQIKDGIVVRVWNSGQEAAESLGLLKSKISNCANGKRKTHGGFEWKLINSEDIV